MLLSHSQFFGILGPPNWQKIGQISLVCSPYLIPSHLVSRNPKSNAKKTNKCC